MAFRTRRQDRYDTLRRSGFLPFEAQELSKVPFAVPYIKPFVRERQGMLKLAKKQGISHREYEATIKELYDLKKWYRQTRFGNKVYDVWQHLREFEDKYKQKHPEYQSPWRKKRKGWKDFVKKVEKTLAKEKL